MRSPKIERRVATTVRLVGEPVTGHTVGRTGVTAIDIYDEGVVVRWGEQFGLYPWHRIDLVGGEVR